MNPEVLAKWLPIGISTLAFCVSCISLGWNIYRDIVLKARIRVRLEVRGVENEVTLNAETALVIEATNHGPGRVHLSGLVGRVAPWWRRLVRRTQWIPIYPDLDQLQNRSGPTVIEVGETASFVLRYRSDSLLAVDGLTHVGVGDSFGRVHYAPRYVFRNAVKRFRSDFPKARALTIEGAWED
jgi:hypothetical protein